MITSEIENTSTLLKNWGYFTNTIDSVRIEKNTQIVYFSLHDFVEKAIINIASVEEINLEGVEINNNSFTTKISNLQNILLNITSSFDQKGKSFTKVQLKNISIKGKTLFADLFVTPSDKRIINNIIIKGYENFPKSFVKNYFKLEANTLLNQQKIADISSKSKNLEFINEIKPPEILFTKDSTKLYVYLSKKQNNSIDGIVNFASKENGGILFNGMLDLRFQNILNSGERFEVFWNSIADERQEFKVTSEIPYIFNSIFSPEISFSIYKQDSTFLNTNFKTNITFAINDNYTLGLKYDSETSENLDQTNLISVTSFSSNFYGIHFSYTKPKNDVFYFNKLYFEINPAFGKRKSSIENSNQFKIKSKLYYIWDINDRNSLFVKNETGFLFSDTYLTNELFRIGGANSIRGFNEQSIFSEKYAFFNIEYRLLTNTASYFYSITDFGRVSSQSEQNNLLGLGLGYFFNTKNSQININTTFGKVNAKPFDFKEVKFIINWKTYF